MSLEAAQCGIVISAGFAPASNFRARRGDATLEVLDSVFYTNLAPSTLPFVNNVNLQCTLGTSLYPLGCRGLQVVVEEVGSAAATPTLGPTTSSS